VAGYSGTPLAKKLGVGDGSVVGVVAGDPAPLPSLPFAPTAGMPATGPFDVLLAFVTASSSLAAGLPAWSAAVRPAGALWVSWPKKSARKLVPSDITEDTIRDLALPIGVVDNKVCAVDDVWSGLRLVWRKELR
jgi:hypothetical protein